MKIPKSETPGTLTRSGFTCRNPNETRSLKTDLGAAGSRSVLECGGPPPLCGDHRGKRRERRQSGGALCLPPQSKTWPPIGFLGCLLLIVGCLSALAQYAIPWHTIDGGGGTSTGGVFNVSGTIGQPDAGGPMTNGQYAVTGGFWALPKAVQTPGAPTLIITPAGPGIATITWTPNTGTNWVLQERLSLSAGAWTNSPSG